MDVTALVMAGGKGTRMSLSEEKPLLEMNGKPLISHVLTALKNARKVNSILVVVSKYTPKTAKLAAITSTSVFETPGKDYVSDMGLAIKRLKLRFVLAIGADLPLVTGEIIDTIIERYQQCGKPALSVVVPMEIKKKLGLGGDYAFEMGNRQVVPAGINLIDGRKIDDEELDEEVYLLDQKEVAVNINTAEELRIAENISKGMLKG